jgi:hypothetical protein
VCIKLASKVRTLFLFSFLSAALFLVDRFVFTGLNRDLFLHGNYIVVKLVKLGDGTFSIC